MPRRQNWFMTLKKEFQYFTTHPGSFIGWQVHDFYKIIRKVEKNYPGFTLKKIGTSEEELRNMEIEHEHSWRTDLLKSNIKSAIEGLYLTPEAIERYKQDANNLGIQPEEVGLTEDNIKMYLLPSTQKQFQKQLDNAGNHYGNRDNNHYFLELWRARQLKHKLQSNNIKPEDIGIPENYLDLLVHRYKLWQMIWYGSDHQNMPETWAEIVPSKY